MSVGDGTEPLDPAFTPDQEDNANQTLPLLTEEAAYVQALPGTAWDSTLQATSGSTNATRTTADGATTNLSPVVTSATIAFTQADVGRGFSGAGIPNGAVILSVQSATQATLNVNATATATNVSITITAGVVWDGTVFRWSG